MRRALLLVLVTACGRLNFEGQNAIDGGTGDGVMADSHTVHTGRPNVMVLGVGGTMSSNNFNAWLTSAAQNRASITGTTTVDNAALASTDLIVLLDPQKTYSAAESTAIANVVARGGGLIGVSGFSDIDRPLFNSAVIGLGAQAYGTTNTDGPVTDVGPHPITVGIPSLPFTGGDELDYGEAAAALGRINGTVIGVAFDLGLGRVMLWGDEWILFDGQWDANVIDFWDNTLAWVWPTQ